MKSAAIFLSKWLLFPQNKFSNLLCGKSRFKVRAIYVGIKKTAQKEKNNPRGEIRTIWPILEK
jgi:hypothetical protein